MAGESYNYPPLGLHILHNLATIIETPLQQFLRRCNGQVLEPHLTKDQLTFDDLKKCDYELLRSVSLPSIFPTVLLCSPGCIVLLFICVHKT